MRKYFAIPVLMFALAPGVYAEDYPTIETVRFVVNCMADLGGQNERNLYACTCRYDALSKKMSYEEYDDAMVFERNKQMPGERGGFVRDNERGIKNYKKFKDLLEDVTAQCPVVKHLESPVRDKDAAN